MTEVCLVTGVAGFIGYFVAQRLLDEGKNVVGIDNLNDYYDVSLKNTRLTLLLGQTNFSFYKVDISNKEDVERVFNLHKFDYVIHLAAQAGVRYSLEHPDIYIQSNIVGFFNILEACRYHVVKHLVYASSSSVYGANKKVPFEETDFVDNPVSLYAATKKSNELMAHAYSHLYNIPSTGLRFFTVYGPMGRPDMAYFGFVDSYFRGLPIKIYNNGDVKHDLYRDFTYIDDIVEGLVKVMKLPPIDEKPKHRVLNIGNNSPVKLMTFIKILEECLSSSLGKKVEFSKQFESIKLGDVPKTYASTHLLSELVGFKPSTSIKEGLQEFTNWYVKHYVDISGANSSNTST